MERRSVLAGLLLAVLVVGLSGCGRFTDTIAPGDEVETFALYGTRTISQRFIAHHAGLVEIGVLLQAQPGSGAVTLHLREDAEGTNDLATVTIVPPASEAPTYHTFALPVQDDVNGKSFLLHLEAPQATAETAALLPYSTGASGELDLWLDGGLSSGGHVSIQLHYDPVFIVKDLVRQASTFGLRSLWLLFLSALFYLLPGGALVVWLLREGDWIERTVVALGMSVAVYALLVYATMTGLRLGRAATYGFLALCAGLIGLRWWLDGRPLPSLRGMWAGLKVDPAPAALAFVFVLVLGVRVWSVKIISFPRWGDSVQHAVITQRIIERGGIFTSWEPYAPYLGFTGHFGFHANVAAFHLLSGLSTVESVLWVGQILNALAVLALYPLGSRMAGRWGGGLAILIAGLWIATPMGYSNWGRYPQLAGQVLLPIGCWLLWILLEQAHLDWRATFLASLAAAAQFLSYYRTPFYYAAWIGGFILASSVPRTRFDVRRWATLALRFAIVAGIAGLLLVPWGLHLAQGRLSDYVLRGVSGGRRLDAVLAELSQWRDLGRHVPPVLLLLAAIGFLCSVLRRDGAAAAMGVWALGMYGSVATRLVGLPGASQLTSFAAMISMYAPTSLLVGWLGTQLIESAQRGRSRLASIAWATVTVVLAILGTWRMLLVLDPSYDLVKPADLQAMAWIRENTPQNARFLVNGFRTYGGNSIVGSDAGWWIPLLAGRENTMPPQYALLTEREAEPGYGRRLVELVAGLESTPLSTSEGVRLACEEGITHVYVGQTGGRVGMPPPQPLFAPQELAASSMFAVLYHRQGVWVFELNGAVCG